MIIYNTDLREAELAANTEKALFQEVAAAAEIAASAAAEQRQFDRENLLVCV